MSVTMDTTLMIVIIVAAITMADGNKTLANNKRCLPWMYRPKGSNKCTYGVSLGGKVHCEIINGSHDVRLQNCLCMTYDNSTAMAEVGYCPYSCISSWRREDIVVRQDSETLNKEMCGTVWKREGRLCSQCQPQHGFPLYSYYYGCVKCEGSVTLQTIKFVAAAYLPLTVMFVVVTAFPLDILSPPWSMFIFVAQLFSAPAIMQGLFSVMQVTNFISFPLQLILTVHITVFGVWNLDFFRAVYSPWCISPHITNIHQAAIEGSIGLCPLFFLAVLSILVRLYKNGNRVIVVLWKPFHYCSCRLKRKLNRHTSLIDVFAAFLLLSYLKIYYAALYILTPTRVWKPNGSYEWVVYYDPSMKYFGQSHIPYATITLVVIILLLLPVLMLLFYPCRWFQKCLNHFHLRSLALHAFMDVFQGCYKDGTNGTKDCRYFSSLQIFLRLFIMFLFSLTTNDFIFAFSTSLLLAIYLILFALVRPYKIDVHNRTDIILISISLCNFVFYLYFSSPRKYPLWTPIAYCSSFGLIIVCYLCYWIMKHSIWKRTLS